MKSNHTSFRFFYILFSVLLLTSIQNVYAQQAVDSMHYYKALALKPQNASDLIISENYFKRNYDEALKKGDLEIATNRLYYLASIAYKKGEYIKSEEAAVKALNYLDKMTTTPA